MEDWESTDYEPSLPISEKSNSLSCDIDRASASGIVGVLNACDAQMFKAKTRHQGLLSDRVATTLVEVAKRVELILKDPKESLVVLSGCGTSGRLAFHIATKFNKALMELEHSLVYSYIIAGGDRALLSSQEAPEDDAKLGVLRLQKACEGKKRVLFIGISCGLSAPFVAGQLHFCLRNLEVFTPVLLGFNPARQARNEPIPGCDFTFHSVVQRLEELSQKSKAFLINPALGPEAISGSSRMKGGSATKILLEVVMSAAHAAAFCQTAIDCDDVLQHIREYRETMLTTYEQREGIAALVETAGESLKSEGRLCYLGWGSLAILGLIDSSECIPTFGAHYEDVRGFVNGGYKELNNNEGPLSALGLEFAISHDDFARLVLPKLTDKDTVILLYTHSDNLNEVVELARVVRDKRSNLHAVYYQSGEDSAAAAAKQEVINGLCSSTLHYTCGPETPDSRGSPYEWELSAKLVLNAVSTGAHILKGKVYRNHMIDLQVTNSKLYLRGVRLLQKLSGQLESQCEEALLKAIYRVNELPKEVLSKEVAVHAGVVKDVRKVIPLALVCLLTKCSVQEAETSLELNPVVRDMVAQWLVPG